MTDNISDMDDLTMNEDLAPIVNNQSDEDRYRVLSPEERGILADIYESLWSEMERHEIKSKLLDHKELLDREITLWTSGCCASSIAFEFHFKTNQMREESIKEYASLIRDGLCHCQRCTTDAIELRSSSCLCRIAAAIGKVWLIEFLLDQGCYPNPASCCYHYTPISLAIKRSNYDIVKLLVQSAPDKLSQPNPNHETLLHEIVQTQSDDRLELMKIVIGVVTCDVNALNDQLETALGLAVRNDQLEIVRLLLDNGADPNIPSERGRPTPLLGLAVQEDWKEMASALIKGGADVNAVFQGQLGIYMTPLDRSIYSHGHMYEHPEFCHATRIEMTRLLLENGANPNLKCHASDFPIVLAAHEKCPKLIELLISYGAEVNGADVNGFTALHYAAWDGRIDTVNVLLASGAGLDTLTSCNNTPLSLAAHGNHLDCLNILLKHKANVDNTDKDMNTPMHYLAFNGNLEGIRTLLHHGAKPDVLNKCNVSPMWNAIYRRRSEVVCLLVRQNVSLDVKSCGNDSPDIDEMMPLYDEPRSLLWVAVERRWMDGVKILLQAGYNIWKEEWLLSGEDQGLSEESHVIIRHLQALVHTPPSLLSSCRKIIKKFVCSDLEKTVQQLPIPVILKDYLLLKDLKLPDCRGGLTFDPSIGI